MSAAVVQLPDGVEARVDGNPGLVHLVLREIVTSIDWGGRLRSLGPPYMSGHSTGGDWGRER